MFLLFGVLAFIVGSGTKRQTIWDLRVRPYKYFSDATNKAITKSLLPRAVNTPEIMMNVMSKHIQLSSLILHNCSYNSTSTNLLFLVLLFVFSYYLYVTIY